MSEIGIGAIGCGGRLRHILKGICTQTSGVKLVALCDTDHKAVEEFRRLFNPQAKIYADYRELVTEPTISAVLIGSWNCFHREHAVAALEAGKDVYCEKPLATTLDDCLSIYKAWQRSGRLFMVGFTLRYSPHYLKIKEIIDSGAIGQPISFEFNETLDFNHGSYIMRCWRNSMKNAGTHLLEKCCHDIDIVNWLCGKKVVMAASFGGLNVFIPENKKLLERLKPDQQGRKPYFTWILPEAGDPFTCKKDVVDNQVSILEFENGVRATFHCNSHSGLPERRLYICGTEGAIRSDVISGKLELRRVGFDEQIQDVATGVSGGHGDGDTMLCQMLIDMITKKKKPQTGIDDAITSAITCFGIDKAMQDRAVVNLGQYWGKFENVKRSI
ncbi:MAG: hypothetical protein A2Y10_00990 [Planctomycetes bacterium GWF2_41_51]|nr:MAG: hypothetical protein A2Y10_00990 [Planctomycetes bacterium GWF2_41_51]HBG26521.1 gfo/Idh/MocA family oxidoreductase [Phycisphaerales bacterium]